MTIFYLFALWCNACSTNCAFFLHLYFRSLQMNFIIPNVYYLRWTGWFSSWCRNEAFWAFQPDDAPETRNIRIFHSFVNKCKYSLNVCLFYGTYFAFLFMCNQEGKTLSSHTLILNKHIFPGGKMFYNKYLKITLKILKNSMMRSMQKLTEIIGLIELLKWWKSDKLR